MTMVRRAFLALATILTTLVGAASARAGDVNIAVAANFTVPAQEIAKAFEAATGDHAVLSFGASGQFYAQITHGAPFEVFLSADADRPAKAEADGLAVPGTRFTYAVGRLVLWSPTPGLVDDRGRVLATGDFKHIAIADPGAAPYGAAAVQTLKTLGLYDRLAPRLVTGASITQALQFVQTGNAELGFVALSQVVDTTGGSRWLVPEADHAPIIQQAVLLKTGAGHKAARAFMAFLKSPRAVSIIRRYGYDLP
jgi:molybdate transport system substrate-binding protein